MGPQVHLRDGETTLPCRTMRDGGKILGTPVGNIHFILSWLQDHFRDNGPPLQILGHLPARAAITLLKFSYNSRMDSTGDLRRIRRPYRQCHLNNRPR